MQSQKENQTDNNVSFATGFMDQVGLKENNLMLIKSLYTPDTTNIKKSTRKAQAAV